MKRLLGLMIWCSIILFVVGCGQNDALLPTAVLQPIEQILPTQSPTSLPATVIPTQTAVFTPTATAFSITPTVTVTTQPRQVETKLKITSPTAGADLIVGEPIMISGEAAPLPAAAQDVLIRILAVGGTELVRETAVIQADGTWSLTTTIPPQVIGSVQLMAQLESSPNAVAVQLNLLPNEEGTSLTLNHPANGGKVVAGYAVLFDGFVSQPISDTVTMAIQTADCTESHTSSSINLQNGRWQGWSVLRPTTAAGAGCAITFTGERGTESAREVRMPVTILDEFDPQAQSLQLGNVGEQVVTAGTTAYFFGVAIQAPNNEVRVQIVADDGGESNVSIVEETAVVNSFGLWESNLEIPLETAAQQALLILAMGEDDTYYEVRQTIFIQTNNNQNE